MTKENYVAVTEPHIIEDLVIHEEELQSIEKTLNAHACQIARIFNLCFEQGDFRRIKQAITNSSLLPPPLRSLRKDHKKLPEEMLQFGPPFKPIGDGKIMHQTANFRGCLPLYVRKQQILGAHHLNVCLRKICCQA